MSDARSIIARLRDGEGISDADAAWFAQGLASGAVDDAQAGAFAMAALLRGTGDAGRVALTKAMRDSGDVLTWDLPGPVVDKHSTGGVGDTVSLILAPGLAACGAYVPMISGRGLGHTGGTLDKMEAIPGYRTDIDNATLDAVLREAGCAIIGATADIAPADRRLYAIRDISGTVESVDLITASILSKKLAAGLEALVLDVKCGSGAFMADLDAAKTLARALVDTANGAGCRTAALISDMNSPLARTAGNAVEVHEAITLLTQPSDADARALRDVTCRLGGEALYAAGVAQDADAGTARILQALETGQAAEVFARMVRALGGPADLLERPDAYLAQGESYWRAPPAGAGRHVAAIDTRAVGDLVVRMGGGRLRSGDEIDMRVGLTHLARVGDAIPEDGAVGRVVAADRDTAEEFFAQLEACYTLSDTPVAPAPLILERVGPDRFDTAT